MWRVETTRLSLASLVLDFVLEGVTARGVCPEAVGQEVGTEQRHWQCCPVSRAQHFGNALLPPPVRLWSVTQVKPWTGLSWAA